MDAFSVVDNVKSIISVERSSGAIPCLDGIRVFNTIMIFLAHKGTVLNYNPFSNKRQMNEIGIKLFTLPARAGFIITDLFFLLSGILVSYSIIGKLQRNQKISIFKEIASRYFRYMPPMAALIIFATFILPKLGGGPQWNLLITYQSDLCKAYGWRNILMIHNWFGFENICMTHTHHIGTEFTLFVVGIFLVIFLFNFPKTGTVLIMTMGLLISYRNFIVVLRSCSNLYIAPNLEWV